MDAPRYRTYGSLQTSPDGHLEVWPVLDRRGRPKLQTVSREYFETVAAVGHERVRRVNPESAARLDAKFPEIADRYARVLAAAEAALAESGGSPHFWAAYGQPAVAAVLAEVQPQTEARP